VNQQTNEPTNRDTKILDCARPRSIDGWHLGLVDSKWDGFDARALPSKSLDLPFFAATELGW